MAALDWMMFQPVPSGSLSGSRKVSTRCFWYWCSTKNHMAMAIGTTAATAPMIQRHCRPAMNSTKAPDARISRPVPRSGCFKMSTKGIRISTRLMTMCLSLGGRLCRARYQAMVAGMMIFMNSEGWKRITPGMLIQRVAPIAVWPMTSTATSRPTPTR